MAALNNNDISLTLKLSIAWWLKWYIYGVIIIAQLTGRKPNDAKVKYWAAKAITVKYVY